MKLSVIVTLLNEEDNIAPLFKNIRDALQGFKYEIILVDDGSTDETVNRIGQFSDDQTHLIMFKKNYGQTSAMAAGIEYATGDYIITMDGDLQNDASDIVIMLQKLIQEDLDVVIGNRKHRKDQVFLRKIPSKIANKIIRTFSGVHLKDYGCSLKVFKRDIAKGLDLYGELHRFIPILAKLNGATIGQIDVNHQPRIHGESKYGLERTMKVISDLMLLLFFQKYFKRPIHLFGPVGLGALFIGIVINTYLLFIKMLGADIWGRPILILGVIMLIAGIQFITFGIIAELVMRIYYGSQNKKTYGIKGIFIGKFTQKDLSETIS